MNSKVESNNELGNPTSFGVVLGIAAGACFGPAGAIAGFAAGAALGFWYNRKQNHLIKRADEADTASQPQEQAAIPYNH